jgi:hypothetical protein
LPLFLLKETEAFVPHDREARTREERPFSGFIKAREGHREGGITQEEKTTKQRRREKQRNDTETRINPTIVFVPSSQN